MAADNTTAAGTPERNYTDFSKGINNEAGLFETPDGFLIDAVNLSINDDGSVSKRPGLVFDGIDGSLIPDGAPTGSTAADQGYFRGVWERPRTFSSTNDNIGVDFESSFFITIGNIDAGNSVGTQYWLRAFPRCGRENNLEISGTVYEVELTDVLNPASAATAYDTLVWRIAEHRGMLFVTGLDIEPFIVRLIGSELVATKINIVVRDLNGLDDSLATDEEPSTLSDEHYYNLLNQGWVEERSKGDTVSVDTFSAFSNESTTKTQYGMGTGEYNKVYSFYETNGQYPPNNKTPYLVVDSDGDPANKKIEKIVVGSGSAAKGHYLFNIFNKDYSAASGIDGLTAVTVDVTSDSAGPRDVAAYAGRVWYAIGDTLYFSQVLERWQQAGMCYQRQDPTAEDLNALLDDDGGYVSIPSCGTILRLIVAGTGLYAFSRQGVWVIGGTSSGFSATDYTVSQITDAPCISSYSVISADGSIYYWSYRGIMRITPSGSTYSASQAEDISTSRIKHIYKGILSLYDLTDIAYASHTNLWMSAGFDEVNHTLYWLCYSTLTDDVRVPVVIYEIPRDRFNLWTVPLEPEQQKFDGSSSSCSACFNYPTFIYDRTTMKLHIVSSFMVISDYSGYYKYTNIYTVYKYWNFFSFTGYPGVDFRTTSGGNEYDCYGVVGWSTVGSNESKKQIKYLTTYARDLTADMYTGLTTAFGRSSSNTKTEWSSFSNLGRGWASEGLSVLEDPVIGYSVDITRVDYYGTIYGQTSHYLFSTQGSGFRFFLKPSGSGYIPVSLSTIYTDSIEDDLGITSATDLDTIYDAISDFAVDNSFTIGDTYYRDRMIVPALTFTTCWDWSNTDDTNRWSTGVDIYRTLRTPYIDEDSDDYPDFPEDVIVGKHRVRGRGRSFAFKFYDKAPFHDFRLLGWSTWLTGTASP